jgi:hypothetical protein
VRLEDDLGRTLVTLLDGTRDRAALAGELRASVLTAGRPAPDELEGELERRRRDLEGRAMLEA